MAAFEKEVVLVLQGGGALGAYQAGAYEALASNSYTPTWVSGISIGAVNGAIIAGNEPQRRVERLREFWNRVSGCLLGFPLLEDTQSRRLFNETSALLAAWGGVPGFFKPRVPPALFLPQGTPEAIGVYDTAPLRETLLELVDFDVLNSGKVRLSVGAVELLTGNMRYFDTAQQHVGPEHIMASGALPPGFSPIEIDGVPYWDGGIPSNTPLDYVLDEERSRDLLIFQVDLFSARGDLPRTLLEAAEREKDIRYSSRTRMNTDVNRRIHNARVAVRDLLGKLPDHLKDDPSVALLREAAKENTVTVVHLIYSSKNHESNSKDYDFSHIGVVEHWDAGVRDVHQSMKNRHWLERPQSGHTMVTYDLNRDGQGAPARKE